MKGNTAFALSQSITERQKDILSLHRTLILDSTPLGRLPSREMPKLVSVIEQHSGSRSSNHLFTAATDVESDAAQSRTSIPYGDIFQVGGVNYPRYGAYLILNIQSAMLRHHPLFFSRLISPGTLFLPPAGSPRTALDVR